MADEFNEALAEALEKTGISRGDIQSLREESDRELDVAQREQREIARNNQDRRHVDGLGEARLSVSPEVYHRAQSKFAQNCWSDPEFIKQVEKDHPELRARSRSGKTMVGYGS